MIAWLLACATADRDGDGHFVPMDCDDDDTAVHPDAGETCGNGVDDDCDDMAAGCGAAGTIDLARADARIVGDAPGGWLEGVAGVGDVDGDGLTDVAFLQETTSVRLFYGPLDGELALDDGEPLDASTDSRIQASALGDLDADGLADLVVVSFPDATDIARVTRFAGSGGQARAVLDLDAYPFAVAVLPDTSGDGVADLVVTAAEAPGADDYRGAAWVIVRDPVGAATIDDVGARLDGVEDGDVAGLSVAGGDVDGDGLTDVLLGAPYAGDVGRAYVVLGPIPFDRALADADATLVGAWASGYFGESIAAGDTDADGYADVLVGAPGDRRAAEGTGAAYLFRFPSTYAYAAYADGALLAPAGEHAFGEHVAVPGDVDGDGRDDLLVASGWGCWGHGCARLYADPLHGVQANAPARATLVGDAYGDMAGYQLGGAGDTDGDGLADLLMYAPGFDRDGAATGAAYLVRGGPGF